MLRVHVVTPADAELSTTLDELVAEGARRMLAAALEAEVDGYICALSDERDDQGHRLVVRNGHAVARSLVLPATLDEDEDDTMSEHHFVNMLSPWWSSVAA